MSRSFAGAGTALVTPFTPAGDLDEAALRRLVRRQVDEGIDVLVPCGTTGESATLTADEQDARGGHHARGVGRARARAGRRRQQRHARRRRDAQAFAALGAQGDPLGRPVLQQADARRVLPPLHAPSPTRVTVPVVVYNVPGRTGSNIDAKTLLRLAAHPNIAAVKEASGNLGQVMEILRDRPAGFEVLSGDDAFTLAFMALGAEGVISVAANQVPRADARPHGGLRARRLRGRRGASTTACSA